MREIKFRGKRVDNAEWIIGSLAMIDVRSQRIGLLNQGSMFICEVQHGWQNTEHGTMTGFWTQVLPETVGQYTGLKDANGVEIYEGDFISTDLQRPYNKVVYKNGSFMFECYDGNFYHDIFYPTNEIEQSIYKYGQVIGNIHDNPEILNA